jgi:hypothetical protein
LLAAASSLVACTAAGLLRAAEAPPAADASSIRPGGTTAVDRSGRRRPQASTDDDGTGTTGRGDGSGRRPGPEHDTTEQRKRRAVVPRTQHSPSTERNAGPKRCAVRPDREFRDFSAAAYIVLVCDPIVPKKIIRNV